MFMKKRAMSCIALLLAAVLVLGLSACGSTNSDVHGTVENAESTVQPTETVAEEADGDFDIGTSNGSVYKNEFLGITAEFGSEWHLYSDEECKKLNEQVLGTLSDDYAQQMKNADYFYDMMATIEETGCSVNVVLQNMGLQAAFANITESLKQGCEGLKTSYESTGYTDVSYEIIKTQFLGEEREGTKIVSKINGVDFYTKQVFYMKGKYAVSVTVCALGTDDCDSMLGMFTALK